MITSIFEFSETTVKEILTPRRDVFALEAESKIDDVWNEILDQGFTRIPNLHRNNRQNCRNSPHERFTPVTISKLEKIRQ